MALLFWGLLTTYQARKVAHQHQAERELQTIGRLRAQALEGWRDARLEDADALSDDALLARALTLWRKPARRPRNAQDATAAQQVVQARLRILQERSRYTFVAFLDLQGQILMAGEGLGHVVPTSERLALQQAVASASTQVVEPRRDPFFAFPFFSTIAPVFDGSEALGAVWLVMDVRTSLYPLLYPWPTPSPTAESMLVSAVGADALLLSPPRDASRPGAGTVVRSSQSTRPVVQAVAGARGVVYGQDDTGTPVLSVVNAIADSPWFLVSSVHVAEAFGNASRRELLVLSLPISFAALIAGLMLGGWQWRARRRESVLKDQLAENMRWLESAQQAASIGYFDYDIAHEQIKLSSMAGTLLGLPSDQPVPRSLWLAQVHEADRDAVLLAVQAATQDHQILRLQYRLQLRAHGPRHERWVDMWGRDEEKSGDRHMTGTVQDISDRRRSEAQLARYRDALEAMVRQDALTGVANRRALTEAVAREWQRCGRTGLPISLLMIDVDHFKPFNDHYGHLAGDDCLRKVAHALNRSATRSGDVVARYGGEEFAVLLPATSALEAWRMAEHARLAVSRLGIAHAASGVATVVTVSIGVATMAPNVAIGCTSGTKRTEIRGQADSQGSIERNSQRLFLAADKALYAAKNDGRNRVAFHDETAEAHDDDARSTATSSHT